MHPHKPNEDIFSNALPGFSWWVLELGVVFRFLNARSGPDAPAEQQPEDLLSARPHTCSKSRGHTAQKAMRWPHRCLCLGNPVCKHRPSAARPKAFLGMKIYYTLLRLAGFAALDRRSQHGSSQGL